MGKSTVNGHCQWQTVTNFQKVVSVFHIVVLPASFEKTCGNTLPGWSIGTTAYAMRLGETAMSTKAAENVGLTNKKQMALSGLIWLDHV